MEELSLQRPILYRAEISAGVPIIQAWHRRIQVVVEDKCVHRDVGGAHERLPDTIDAVVDMVERRIAVVRGAEHHRSIPVGV